MPVRALVVLIIALAASSLLVANASAAQPPKKKDEVRKILRDCAKDGDLDRPYSLRGLKRALRVMGDDLRDYTDCEHVIKRAIKKAVWRKLRPEVKKIYRDCARDDDLDRRYSLPALKLALKRLPDDLDDYTGCRKAIKRAIRRELRKLKREVMKIFRDCARDDDLDRRYSLPALKLALKWLPDDLDRYTDCRKAIKRAIKKAPPHKHHGKKHHGHKATAARLRTI